MKKLLARMIVIYGPEVAIRLFLQMFSVSYTYWLALCAVKAVKYNHFMLQ